MLLEEVILNLKRAEGWRPPDAALARRCLTTLDVPVPKFKPMGQRTDEDTLSLLPRLATLYPDKVIAGIFNRQARKTATGERFTANQSRQRATVSRYPALSTISHAAQWRPGHHSQRRRRFWE